MNADSPYLTGKPAVAKYLGVSRPTVEKLLESGDIPYMAILDKIITVKKADVDAFMASKVVPVFGADKELVSKLMGVRK